MHTEEIRARRAAQYFRTLLESSSKNALSDAASLLRAADERSGFVRIQLPPDDPLLAGGDALLDRDFKTIWVNKDRSEANQNVDAAHEYGHLVLHPFDGENDDWRELFTHVFLIFTARRDFQYRRRFAHTVSPISGPLAD